MSTTRIYRIDDGHTDHLVRAASRAQAIGHVARNFAVRVATQRDLETLLTEGAKVEDAGEPGQAPE